jgi:xanthine dehydrogenase YagR molybdenum-binding subunit
LEYHLPVRRDCPPIEAHLLEERDDLACAIQSKGIGEVGISGAGAAVRSAIHNTIGVQVRDYPATLDRVLPGLPA